ncbi:hypothetical protein [Brevundimonas diminuta]|uniref:hypothetical protein n=1 Tax=Brevundimonas diminuta TaxID=293 RepID=UPI003209F0CD
MRRRAEGARDDIDMLPAWAALAHGLGDGHSFVQPTPEAIAAWRERYGDRPLRVEISSPALGVHSAFSSSTSW